VPHLVYAVFPFDAEQRIWHSTFVIDISDTFEQKLEAIRCYESQFDAERFAKVRHFVGGYNITQGARCGFAYGELFALPHPIGATDLHALVLGGKGSPAPVQLPGQSHLPMN
jgi:LmbE family N-acetylglucosaminyl deacetylase